MASYPFKHVVKTLKNVRADMQHYHREFLRYAFGIIANIVYWPTKGFRQGQQSFGIQGGVLIPQSHDWKALLAASGVDPTQAFEIDMPYQVSTESDGSIWISFTSVGWECNASDLRLPTDEVSEIDIMLLCRNILAYVELDYVYRFLDEIEDRPRNVDMIPRIMTALIVGHGWTVLSGRGVWSLYFVKYILEQKI